MMALSSASSFELRAHKKSSNLSVSMRQDRQSDLQVDILGFQQANREPSHHVVFTVWRF